MVNLKLFSTTCLQKMVSFAEDIYVIKYQTSQLLFRINILIKIFDSKNNKIKKVIEVSSTTFKILCIGIILKSILLPLMH